MVASILVSLVFTLFCLFATLPAHATPVPPDFSVPSFDPQRILCQLPIIKKILLCPATGPTTLTRQTVIGVATGAKSTAGALRFSVKYASATRWKPSKIAASWMFPDVQTNASSLPLACPQPGVDPSAYSEDCLSMVLYVPPSFTVNSAAPTLVWIHGGSFIVGSATGPGLDGSKLAIATQSIVAVVQYRLGALSFMSPDGTTNLGVKDLVSAMQFLKLVVPSFGGNPSKITLAGQSSGANMIRALLAVPSATSLFRTGILQSDPMNFGFLAETTQQTLQGYYNSLINCGPTDTVCSNALSLDAILNAQSTLFTNAASLDPAAGTAEPIRPVLDGNFITSPLDSTGSFPSVSKPLIISTVQNEAGPTIYGPGGFPSALPVDEFEPISAAVLGPDRANIIASSPFYEPTPAQGISDARVLLQTLGTDYIWKCSTSTFARNWVQHGGVAYVGQYVVGATYPGNDVISYCTQQGTVCHQDDIQIVFGTVPNPTSAQSSLTSQIQSRYKAFLANGNPNVSGVPKWTAATTSNVHSLLLGGSGEASAGACVPTFWGLSPQYDYQVFNN